MKKIGILTSGGDAPGMNAVIRSVVCRASEYNMRVVGVKFGYNGLINGNSTELDLDKVAYIQNMGGTILYSARSEEFRHEDGQLKAKRVCDEFGIDGLIVCGGDGSFRGASDFSKLGTPCVCIPGTIDNDLGCSDYSIGFNTAVETACDLISKIRDTSRSHERISVVEVMGRSAGYIALHAGLACGVTAIMIKEAPVSIEEVAEKINKTLATRNMANDTYRDHFMIIVSEGLGGSQQIADDLHRLTGVDTRLTVLGHVQRGGVPSPYDRIMASRMGYYAVDLLSRGISDKVVVYHDHKITDMDIQPAVRMKKPFDNELMNIARSMLL